MLSYTFNVIQACVSGIGVLNHNKWGKHCKNNNYCMFYFFFSSITFVFNLFCYIGELPYNASVKGQSRYPLINITDIPSYVTTYDGHDVKPIENTSGNRLSAEPRESANRKREEAGHHGVALPFMSRVKPYMFG